MIAAHYLHANLVGVGDASFIMVDNTLDIVLQKSCNIPKPPEHSVLYGDRAYSSASFEAELQELGNIALIPQRKRAAKNQHPGYLRFLQSSGRKVVETVFSQIARIMPRAFVVRTAKGLHLRIILMLLAYIVNRFIPNLTP